MIEVVTVTHHDNNNDFIGIILFIRKIMTKIFIEQKVIIMTRKKSL